MKRNLVLASVLLLASFTCVSAQERDDEISLQGLPGIRFAISWGTTDPIAGDRLAGWVKMLQDRADQKLKEAGIPILKHMGQTEPAGDPVLVVHIRLQRPHASTTLAEFETKFWQKVQLSRDPSKKLNAVTWETFGLGGPEVTDQLLLALLDDQLNRFIKAFKTANPTIARGH
jgi:hypothetical protein